MSIETLLTIPEKKVLAVLKRLIAEKGYAPTVRELQIALGYSTNSVAYYHLGILREKGYVNWEDGKSRTLKILKEA